MNKDRHSTNEIKEEEILLHSAQEASSKAMRTSMAMGLSVKVIRDNKIIEISPDRTERFVRKLAVRHKAPSIVRGTVLKRK